MDLTETDHVVNCAYCRVKSYLVQKDYFRYMLPHDQDHEKDLVYFPYWRFKGTMFSYVIPDTINKRFMDISHQALPLDIFPASLGLRPQALKLKFITPETAGRFIEPKLDMKQIMDFIKIRFNCSLKTKPLYQEFIGENLSMLYAPFYEKQGKLMDAVLDEPVFKHIPQDINVYEINGGKPGWQIKFISTLCPECGWDLDGESDALVMVCRNCHTLWQPYEKRTIKLPFKKLPSDKKPAIWLPFWRIKAEMSDIKLENFEDLIKIANLPRVAQKGDDKAGFYFWTPAFKLLPRYFLIFSHRVTLSQPRETLVDEMPEEALGTVTFPVTEAVKSLKINLAGFMKPARVLESIIQDIYIRPRKYLLVYLPFEDQGHELVNLEYKLAINKNMMMHSRNL
ncbi:hypothetical protein [Desulfonema limicola]|uniref:hypothetical protein n=1 Tax=Desulfonema limicola TaxID=45656 RepID=UPI001A9BD731|nr:hypothetical protein [Desulfonema limicola]